MPTAPSFKDFEVISKEPFLKNGKTYITVKNPKNGNTRDVRWYTDKEYEKSFKEKVSKDDGFPLLKHARGFDNGPILVIRRNRPEDEPWLTRSNARYAVGIGWYIVSTEILPDDAPPHFKYLLLHWDEFRNGDDFHMKSPEEVAKILDRKVKNREWISF